MASSNAKNLSIHDNLYAAFLEQAVQKSHSVTTRLPAFGDRDDITDVPISHAWGKKQIDAIDLLRSANNPTLSSGAKKLVGYTQMLLSAKAMSATPESQGKRALAMVTIIDVRRVAMELDGALIATDGKLYLFVKEHMECFIEMLLCKKLGTEAESTFLYER